MEKFILAKMLINNGVIDLILVKNLFKSHNELSIDDWSNHVISDEPQWVYQIKTSHQSLKDKGLVYGSEFGSWQLTEKGTEIVKQFSLFDPKNEDDIDSFIVFEDNEEPPITIQAIVYRRIRDTKTSKQLKELYKNSCQVCGKKIYLGEHKYYSEAHHLKPLGSPHNGPDIVGNLIVLCPNHHVEFDSLAIAVNPQTGFIEHVDLKNDYTGEKLLLNLHSISSRYLRYHYQRFILAR